MKCPNFLRSFVVDVVAQFKIRWHDRYTIYFILSWLISRERKKLTTLTHLPGRFLVQSQDCIIRESDRGKGWNGEHSTRKQYGILMDRSKTTNNNNIKFELMVHLLWIYLDAHLSFSLASSYLVFIISKCRLWMHLLAVISFSFVVFLPSVTGQKKSRSGRRIIIWIFCI